ncbi:AP2-ERF domain [Babesia duncani]|uniref:AP2-ERF domain n=1 Tax=Babesia duncani TaxID=323732 RepID=A0AAD9PLF3_9APIC|nr:AP2-ERF domain [Babesia duncani]
MKLKKIPKDALIIPNIPEDDYFSKLPGVYYHFTKQEWRTTCKDPVMNSKRWQRTFGVNKYGFYEAKHKAEATNVASKQQRLMVLFSDFANQNPNGYNYSNQAMPLAQEHYIVHACPYCKCIVNPIQERRLYEDSRCSLPPLKQMGSDNYIKP